MIRQAKNKFYTFSIPCKPYIRQYIAALYGDSFIADNHTSLGAFVRLCLSKKNYRYDKLPVRCPNHYAATLNISIALWDYKRLGSDIAPNLVVAINAYAEELFAEHLHWWCHIHTKIDARYKGYGAALRSFAAEHGIVLDEDSATPHINFDSLKRKELRHRLAREKRIAPKLETISL